MSNVPLSKLRIDFDKKTNDLNYLFSDDYQEPPPNLSKTAPGEAWNAALEACETKEGTPDNEQ